MSKQVTLNPVIRLPLFLFFAILIISVIIIVMSDSYQQHAYQDRESENRAMRVWKNKIDEAKTTNSIIDEYEKSYVDLVKNNIVGEEDRLDWIENLQSIANSRGMPSVKYNLSSQKLVEDKTGQHGAQGLTVYRSDMTLEMKMAHEGDLFAILNTLEARAKGLFTADQCNIEKLSNTSAGSSENMSARCELGWYTFRSNQDAGK